MNTLQSDSTRKLRSGRQMPVLGLGTWQLKPDTRSSVQHAIHTGFRMIDTSGDYGTQRDVGEAIRGVDRAAVFVVTKVEEDEDAYDAARRNVEELQLDHVDLVLLHRPPERGVGVKLWKGLMRARREGVTREIGVSNYSAEQIEKLTSSTGEAPAVNQVEWTPFGHSDRMLGFCRNNGIQLQAYSPLTRGQRLDEPHLKTIAWRHDKTPAQVLIRWNLQLGVVPLPKARLEAHQREDFDVFDFDLSEHEMSELGSLNERYSSLGKLPYQ